MNDIVFYTVPMLYAAFVALDVISLFPRIAGSLIGKNGIAYSFQVMTTTLRRVFIVIYPPLLGFINISGSLDDLFRIVLVSYGAAVLTLFSIFMLRVKILSFYCASLNDFSENGKLLQAFLTGFRNANQWNDVCRDISFNQMQLQADKKRFSSTIVLTATWIYFFYAGTPFLINALGMKFNEHSSIILQLTGLSNALGTLALAFFLDPKLSRIYENQTDLPVASQSLFLAHLINLCVISPIFFYTLSVVMA